MSSQNQPVRFTSAQIAFLQREFPEQVAPNMSADARLWNAAQRHLISCIEGWVAKPGEAY